MMNNPLGQQVDVSRYLRLFWKWKWLVIVPAVIFPLAAGYFAMQLPDSFKSSTLILVTPQKVPTNIVPTTVTTSIEERLNTISQQIFSRTRLEQIIQEFNLFDDIRKQKTPEEVIDLMRSRIQLNVNRQNAFQLSFVDRNPRLAMLVTNKLASLFIEENLKVREQQAMGTSQFLEDEIARYREKVRGREAEIFEFKRQHLNEMPEQVAANQAKLNQLQNQLQINSQNINAAEGRKVELQRQAAELERQWASRSATQSASGPDTSISRMLEQMFQQREVAEVAGVTVDETALEELDAAIAAKESELSALLLRYTARHPDAVALSGTIERLRARRADEAAAVEEQRSRLEAEARAAAAAAKAEEAQRPQAQPEPVVEVAAPARPPALDRLEQDILRAEAEIARLTAQNQEITALSERYQQRIGAAPGRQLQLQQLSEDYDNIKSVLENLINKKLQADLSENLERKQKGEQFKILDPANLPEKPFLPSRMRFVGGGLAAGLALGVGFILLMDFLDGSVKNKDELAGTVDVPVMVVIPEILTSSDMRRRWTWRIGLSGALALTLLLAVGIVHLKVKPLPQAMSDLYSQVKTTHWTTIR